MSSDSTKRHHLNNMQRARCEMTSHARGSSNQAPANQPQVGSHKPTVSHRWLTSTNPPKRCHTPKASHDRPSQMDAKRKQCVPERTPFLRSVETFALFPSFPYRSLVYRNLRKATSVSMNTVSIWFRRANMSRCLRQLGDSERG